MLYSKQLKSAAILGIAATAMMGTGALASPGSGITPSSPLVTANLTDDIEGNHDRVKFQTKDATIVRVQSLTFGANSFSGWHHHPGIVVVAVQSGLVNLTDANCGSRTYGPSSPNGAVFVERDDGANEASSAAGAVVYATFIVPASNPPASRYRVEDPVPSCVTP